MGNFKQAKLVFSEKPDNPYKSPASAFRERDHASSFNPYLGLLWAPVGAGAVSFATALIAVLLATRGVDNPAVLPVLLMASCTLVPLVVGALSLLIGAPLIWLLRQVERLTPGWIVISGGMLTAVLILALSMGIGWLEYSRGRLDSSVTFLFSSIVLLTFYVGLPCFGAVCTYAWWLSYAMQKAAASETATIKEE